MSATPVYRKILYTCRMSGSPAIYAAGAFVVALWILVIVLFAYLIRRCYSRRQTGLHSWQTVTALDRVVVMIPKNENFQLRTDAHPGNIIPKNDSVQRHTDVIPGAENFICRNLDKPLGYKEDAYYSSIV